MGQSRLTPNTVAEPVEGSGVTARDGCLRTTHLVISREGGKPSSGGLPSAALGRRIPAFAAMTTVARFFYQHSRPPACHSPRFPLSARQQSGGLPFGP